MKVIVKSEEGNRTFTSLQHAVLAVKSEQSLIAIDAFKGEQDIVGFDEHGLKIRAWFIPERIR